MNFTKFLRTHFLTEYLRWLLLRAPNFLSVPRLCTIHNTSNSLAKAHLRIPFLQNNCQWLLPVAACKCQLFFLKRKKQKQFFIPPLTLIRLKSCNYIKIKILFIHDSEKTTRIYLPILSIQSTKNHFMFAFYFYVYIYFYAYICLHLNFCRRH